MKSSLLGHATGAVLLALLAACGSGSGGSHAGDAGGKACARAPAATLATDASARALSSAAGRCGQPAFAWLADPAVGTPTRLGPTQTFTPAALGVLLAAGNLSGAAPPLPVTTVQFDYVTQDRGGKLDASALVAFPDGAGAGATRATTYDVVLVLHGTAGFTDACAPSSVPTTGQLLAAVASLGYVAVAPDYIGLRALEGPTGLLHPYLVGQATAIASLDAARAAVRLVAGRPEPTCASPRVAVLGGSQGGHAALWVDRLAPYYAPELDLVGVVATVPPADLVGESVLAITSDIHSTGNAAVFLAAAGDWYGKATQLSSALIPPLDAALPAAMAASCDPSGAIAGKTHDQIFTAPLLAAAAAPALLAAQAPWGCVIAENGLTTTSVARRAPVAASYGILWVNGQDDQIVDTPTERAAFQTLCGQGMAMEFLECAGASHTQTTTWSLPESLDFVRDRFAGKPLDPATTCALSDPVTCRGTPPP